MQVDAMGMWRGGFSRGWGCGARLNAPVVEHAVEREIVQHVVAEAADGALLDGDQYVVLRDELGHEVRVERLHPPGSGEG